MTDHAPTTDSGTPLPGQRPRPVAFATPSKALWARNPLGPHTRVRALTPRPDVDGLDTEPRRVWEAARAGLSVAELTVRLELPVGTVLLRLHRLLRAEPEHGAGPVRVLPTVDRGFAVERGLLDRPHELTHGNVVADAPSATIVIAGALDDEARRLLETLAGGRVDTLRATVPVPDADTATSQNALATTFARLTHEPDQPVYLFATAGPPVWRAYQWPSLAREALGAVVLAHAHRPGDAASAVASCAASGLPSVIAVTGPESADRETLSRTREATGAGADTPVVGVDVAHRSSCLRVLAALGERLARSGG